MNVGLIISGRSALVIHCVVRLRHNAAKSYFIILMMIFKAKGTFV
jgi:hypothetical protein